jgi:Arc/MetJ family transcription regulator
VDKAGESGTTCYAGLKGLLHPKSWRFKVPTLFRKLREEGWGTLKQGIVLHIAMCNNLHMATNLALDDKLIEEAQKAGGHRTKKDAVTAALAEYVKRHKQQRILDAFGTFDFDPAYDYKSERRRSR